MEEVRPLLPAAADFPLTRTVAPPTKARDERVVTFLCFDSGTELEVFSSVRSKLTALGWTDIETDEQTEDGAHKHVLTARKPPYNLTGEVVRTSAPPPDDASAECLASKGQTLVGVIAYHLVPSP